MVGILILSNEKNMVCYKGNKNNWREVSRNVNESRIRNNSF